MNKLLNNISISYHGATKIQHTSLCCAHKIYDSSKPKNDYASKIFETSMPQFKIFKKCKIKSL